MRKVHQELYLQSGFDQQLLDLAADHAQKLLSLLEQLTKCFPVSGKRGHSLLRDEGSRERKGLVGLSRTPIVR